MDKINILFLIPTLKGGGAERVLLNLLKNLPRDLYNLELVSIFRGELPESLSFIKYRYMFQRVFRGNIHLFKLASPHFLFRHYIGDPNQYDVIVSYLHSPTMRIAGGAIGSKAKTVNWIHNEFRSAAELSRMFRTKKEFEGIMKGYDRTIFVADSARLSTIKLLPFIEQNSRTIYNTIESDVILSKSKEPIEDANFDEDTFNLISVGRFSQAKAFDRLLRIVKRIAETGRKVHLHLLGKGTLEKLYKDEINRLGIQNLVSFPGFVENPYKYVANADLFVCSSIHEGYSTAVTESLIVGTPVVTTSCSGMEELLGSNGEYGIITENDENALSEAVVRVVESPQLLKELQSKAVIRGKQFSKDKTVPDVVELFRDLMYDKA